MVDDDRQSREALSEWLEEDGFEIIAVEDGEQALTHLQDGISVVATDLKMPRTDGLELLRQVKDKAPHAAVILVTGYGTAESAVEAFKQGAFD